MSAHKEDACTGKWWIQKRSGGYDAECDLCHAKHPANTVEEMRPFIEENYHGVLLLCAERGARS